MKKNDENRVRKVEKKYNQYVSLQVFTLRC